MYHPVLAIHSSPAAFAAALAAVPAPASVPWGQATAQARQDYLDFTAPNHDPEAFALLKRRLRPNLENQAQSPGAVFGERVRAINTVNHMFGSRRFDTIDESRNNPVTAFFAVGEGWHNNHHARPRCAVHGIRWWQVDISWMFIRVLERLGLAHCGPLLGKDEVLGTAGQRVSDVLESVAHEGPAPFV